MEPKQPYTISIKQQPITVEHEPYVPKPGDELIDAGTARATLAVSKENPNGTVENDYAAKNQHLTVRKHHLASVPLFDQASTGRPAARYLLGP